jgi:hypothetical protein
MLRLDLSCLNHAKLKQRPAVEEESDSHLFSLAANSTGFVLPPVVDVRLASASLRSA